MLHVCELLALSCFFKRTLRHATELWPSHVTLKMLGLQLQKQRWGYPWIPGTLRVIKGKSLRSALFRAYLPSFGQAFFLQGFSKNCYPVIGIRKQEFSMPDSSNSNVASENAQGGRSPQTKGAVPNSGGSVSKDLAGGPLSQISTNEPSSKPAGFGDKDVNGSLKIHIKIDLEADIRVIAKVKGDIAIGLL